MTKLTDIAKKVKSVKSPEDIDFLIEQLQTLKKSMFSEVALPNPKLLETLERGATTAQIMSLGIPNVLEELEKISYIKIHEKGNTRYLLK